MRRATPLFCACLLALVAAAAACGAGDKACHCQRLGGEWRGGKGGVVLPTCRVSFNHQGRRRWAHVYLPSSYDGSKRFPLWVHLHGVFWNTMDNVGSRVGPIDATDINPTWDHTVELFGQQAIIVYPQAAGNAGTGNPSNDGYGAKFRQFFNVPFWRCSVGVCAEGVDDIGFIERVMTDLAKRLPVRQGQVLLTGESAGGMLVHALLCQSRPVAKMVTAASDILGGVGADYARGGACSGSPPVAFLKMHGVRDPFITYDRQILVDGVNFLSAIEATQLRAARNGCGANGASAGPTVSDGQMTCRDFCGNKAGALPAKLCGMTQVAHDTDHPWPGFAYTQAWQFFQSQLAKRG